MTTAGDVGRLLPHRFPMLLVDRIVDLVPGQCITATKAITRTEPCYRRMGGHGRDEELEYPQALIIESWGQTAGILARWQPPGGRADERVMLLGGVTGIEFHRPVLPGDVLEHRARLFRELSDTAIFEGETVCGGEPVMSVERMVMAFRPAGQLRPHPS